MNNKTTIISLHGFGSDGEGKKPKALRNSFPEYNIISPTLPIEPNLAVQTIGQLINENSDSEIYIVGTSLGGFYAFFLSHIYDITTILVNPSLEPCITLKQKLGLNKRYNTKDEFNFKEEYLTQLESMWDRIDHDNIREKFLNFFLAIDDEILDHLNIENDYRSARTIKYYQGVGHRFTKFEEYVVPEIRRIIDEDSANNL